MTKFKNKYRIETTRLKNWNYGWNALYFVTICTQNRISFFGNIVDKKMELSEIGYAAEKYWFEIPEHFPFVKLREFVVMPNHIHGIIEIAKNDAGHNGCGGGDGDVETQNFASLPQPQPQQYTTSSSKNKFGPQSQNLASIIRGYKIGVTKFAKTINNQWGWQPRFHDHIIRDDKSLQNISNYIINNPTKWEEDTFNTTSNNPNSDK